MKIPIDKIIVGDRQRTDLGDPLTELSSMGDPDVGQINAITVERQLDGSYLLIAGNRRLTKAKSLGWKDIEANERTGISEIQRQKMEFCEDVERKDRTWQEKCRATYKLHTLMRMERRLNHQSAWTLRAMATFTGFEKSSIGYMLQIGEALSSDPPDKEIAEADGYTKAIAVLVERTAKEVQKEMERRRTLLAQADATQLAIPGVVGEAPPPADEALPASHVQLLDTTEGEGAPARTPKVKLHGRNKAFRDAVPHTDFTPGLHSIILGYRAESEDTENLLLALRPNGYAVVWESVLAWDEMDERRLYTGPFLIWNYIEHDPEQSGWPFNNGHTSGAVHSLSKPAHTGDTQSTVITAMKEEGDQTLPLAVVDYSLSHIVPANMAVLCICGVDPVHVAQLGRVPIWFEEDPLRYEATVKALREHYEATIPGVVVET